MKSYSTIALLLAGAVIAYSQKPPIKFGDVTAKDLKDITYELDTSAEAVVLADYGVSTIRYIDGFKYVFERTTRIQILSKDGFEWADVSIPVYNYGGSRERITKMKGFTYNLENGKLVKSKLGKEDRFEEEYNKYYNLEKFTMPNVKEGSIIEYQYSITSDFFTDVRVWEFQKSIPVVWSEYIVKVPEYYNYQKMSQGYLPFFIAEENYSNNPITINIRTEASYDGGLSGPTRATSNSLTYLETNYRYAMKDVPAFIREPFISSSKNYVAKITFELDFTKWPDGSVNRILGDWNTLTRYYLEHDNFGITLNQTGFIKRELELIIKDSQSQEEKLSAIFQHVQKRMTWNEYNSDFANSSLKKVYDEGNGNSAEVNMILTAFLREADINADPVIISTRSNGHINQNFAIAKKFNYLICRSQIDGKTYLMDATDKYVSPGELPYRCLNGQGWAVSKERPGWVDLTTVASANDFKQATLEMSEDGIVSGSINMIYKGYHSYGFRSFIDSKGEEKYIEDLKENNQDWLVEDISFENLDDPTQPFVQKIELEISDMAMQAGSMVYIEPLFGQAEEENEFKLDKRDYPVDLGYPKKEQIMVSLTIPDGYEVEELPQNMAVALPGKDAMFQYSVSAIGATIQVMSIITYNKTLFLPAEYAHLKEFTDIIVAKQGEQIVLKKKT